MLPLTRAMLIPLPTLFFTLLISLKQTREDNEGQLTVAAVTWTEDTAWWGGKAIKALPYLKHNN